MSVTGSGKSSFIEHCSGKPVQIGHNLRAGEYIAVLPP